MICFGEDVSIHPKRKPHRIGNGWRRGGSTLWTLGTPSWNLGSKQPLVDVWLLKSLTSKKSKWSVDSRITGWGQFFSDYCHGCCCGFSLIPSGFLTKFSIPGSKKSPELPWWSKIQPVHRHERLKTEVATYSHLSHEKNLALLSIECWLINKNPYIGFGLWNNPYIAG